MHPALPPQICSEKLGGGSRTDLGRHLGREEAPWHKLKTMRFKLFMTNFAHKDCSGTKQMVALLSSTWTTSEKERERFAHP